VVGTAFLQKIFAINLDTRQVIWSLFPVNSHGSGEPYLAVADGWYIRSVGSLIHMICPMGIRCGHLL